MIEGEVLFWSFEGCRKRVDVCSVWMVMGRSGEKGSFFFPWKGIGGFSSSSSSSSVRLIQFSASEG